MYSVGLPHAYTRILSSEGTAWVKIRKYFGLCFVDIGQYSSIKNPFLGLIVSSCTLQILRKLKKSGMFQLSPQSSVLSEN